MSDELGPAAWLVIHSTASGPAFGGIRRAVYPSPQAALEDASRLAAAMTSKCALAGLPAGGAKSVILSDPRRDPLAVYQALAELIETLDGAYVCGPDVGTGDRELDVVRSITRHVNPPGNTPGRSTAQGVAAGMHGLCRFLYQTAQVRDRTIAIQGLGSVGRQLATHLLPDNEVLGWDLSPGTRRWATEHGITLVENVLDAPADILAPCALGAVLTVEQAGSVQCAAICGSANNQLAAPEAEDVLCQRDITFVPDEVVSAGAVIEGVYTVLRGDSPTVRDRITQSIAAIADTVVQVLGSAADENITATEAARHLAVQRLIE